ncbi:MAG TPA: CocE/NonD family hydrolase [Xenococcaceae cyanobacterium]
MTTIVKETGSMLTRDGVRLDADIYRPETKAELPILLMRQPYGRAIASTVVYAHPCWYASQGYMVVIQDVRGRGTSEGKFELFTHEVADGLDTINWVSQLPRSTGAVGMYGFSYQGMTQLYTAVQQPPALKAIAPAMVADDLYSDWAYENQAFCWQINLAWGIQLAAETARLQGDETAYQQLKRASGNLPLEDLLPANPKIMQHLAADSFYHDWLNHPLPGDYWAQLSPKNLLQNTDIPMLHIGGWFDPYLRGTLNLYRAMKAKSQYPQHLIVAPWAHLPWGRKLGAVDYGIEAQNSIDEIQIRWFDHFLKNKDTGMLTEPAVSLFEMGSNQWRYFTDLPQNEAKIYYLASDGLANIREDSGELWEYLAEELRDVTSQTLLDPNLPEVATEFSNTTDTIVHDPWRPVPALGGHSSFPSGSFERSGLDCRADILTYTSAPLEADLHLVGVMRVEIYATADTPSFDLCAILSVVHPNRKVFNFTQGYIRVDSPQAPITIPLQATCIKISQHHCLRLSLSGACFPAYPVNPGTGQFPHETRLIDAQIITLTIKSGADYPSLIKLSIAPEN